MKTTERLLVWLTALSWSLAGALGSFGGGLIMSRWKLTPVGAVRLIIFATSGFIVGVVIFLFLGCPQVNMAGRLDPDDGRYSMVTPTSVTVRYSVKHFQGASWAPTLHRPNVSLRLNSAFGLNMILTFDLSSQQCPLLWWILVPSFTEIVPVTEEKSRHVQ